MKTAKSILAEKIRDARDRLDLTQEAFSSKAKISLRGLQDIEGGKSIDPKLSTLLGVSKLTGLPIDIIVGNALDPKTGRYDFLGAADFLTSFAKTDFDTKHVILAVLYQNQSYLREVSRDGLSRALKLLSPATKPK